MTKDAPKCPRCDGWGHEPQVVPMRDCEACGGTGRPVERQAALVEAR
jgi:DnaJ-class molecular chaperone